MTDQSPRGNRSGRAVNVAAEAVGHAFGRRHRKVGWKPPVMLHVSGTSEICRLASAARTVSTVPSKTTEPVAMPATSSSSGVVSAANVSPPTMKFPADGVTVRPVRCVAIMPHGTVGVGTPVVMRFSDSRISTATLLTDCPKTESIESGSKTLMC